MEGACDATGDVPAQRYSTEIVLKCLHIVLYSAISAATGTIFCCFFYARVSVCECVCVCVFVCVASDNNINVDSGKETDFLFCVLHLVYRAPRRTTFCPIVADLDALQRGRTERERV